MNASIAALAYLVSGVLFILSLRGLSSPETSRRGNTLGMVGMALAVAVTLATRKNARKPTLIPYPPHAPRPRRGSPPPP